MSPVQVIEPGHVPSHCPAWQMPLLPVRSSQITEQ
jgi:hypothetical protein